MAESPTGLPADHPARRALADEVHARPPEPLATPCRLTHLALLVDAGDRGTEAERLAQLCAAHAIAPPPPDARQFTAATAAFRLKWERHGEFSTWTVIADGVGDVASPGAAAALPPGWLAALPGTTVMCAHAAVVDSAALPAAGDAAAAFGLADMVGAECLDGAAAAFTDFRIHADGCGRFVVVDRGLRRTQAGRLLQRLFEIETYRMLALLALPVARTQAPRLAAIEAALAALTANIARDAGADEALLQRLTALAAEVESMIAATQFRYGACRAYAELVRRRIAELRETRIAGMQTLGEFMARRFEPAVATCATVEQRLEQISDRVAQASALLSTRVDIARERQNQALLAAMARRAKLQLRLSQTVEGLSVAAITYYAVGLVGYLAKAGKAAGMPLDPELAMGLAVPLVALGVAWMLRRAHHRLARGGDDAPGT